MKRRAPFMLRMTKFLVGFKLTPIGRIAVLGIFLSAVGGVTVEIPIYQIFCGFICLFGIIEATGIALRPQLEVSAWLPEKVTVGETVTGYVNVVNQGWFPACDIMCAFFGMPKELKHTDADCVVHTIPRGEKITLPFTIMAKSRGEFILPEARVHSTFPFNLMRFGKAKIPECELRVLPTFSPLERLGLPFSYKSQNIGMTADTRAGNSPEYLGNRDYIPGEPARRLDFKAWARVGRPVVREFQEEFNSEVAIVLDTHRPWSLRHRKRDRRKLEASVSLAAAIAHHLDQRSIPIETFLAGQELHLLQSSAEATHFESVMDVLSEVDFTRIDQLPQLLPMVSESFESVTIAFCVFIDWDENRERFTREIVESGCAVKIFVVNDGRQLSLPIPRDDDNITLVDPQLILNGEVREL